MTLSCKNCIFDNAICPINRVYRDPQIKSVYIEVNKVNGILFSPKGYCNFYRQFKDLVAVDENITKENTKDPNQLNLF